MKWKLNNPSFESDKLNPGHPVSPWGTNRLFGYDYVFNIQPQTIVELGTHTGCSLFSFAQAIKDTNCNSQLTAIDTWRGDKHAGYYDHSVYDLVIRSVRNKYKNIKINLIKNTFDQAVCSFTNESIDLLHIDGLHTYNAIKHDFESWLPKLAKNGVVFFHDVGELARKQKYGSAIYWDEIKIKYPHHEFSHSWGLGILYPNGPKVYNLLESVGSQYLLNYYSFRQLYNLEAIKVKDHILIVNNLVSKINFLEKQNALEIDKSKSLEAIIQEKDESIRLLQSKFPYFIVAKLMKYVKRLVFYD